MKKFYTLALACAVGASAFAAAPVSVKKSYRLYDDNKNLNPIEALAQKAEKAPQKVAASAFDIEGFYVMDYVYPFQSGDKTSVTANVMANSETQIVIELEPYCNGYSNVEMEGLIASYDAATGTITIATDENSDLGSVTYSGKEPLALSFAAQQLIPIPNDPEGKGQWTQIDELKGVVNADGTIQFGDADTMFGFVREDGYWMDAFRNAKLVAPDFFKFNAAEWESVGDALFTEDWMNRMLTGDDAQYKLQPRNIPLMRNKENPKLFLVENPFKINNWVNEEPGADGYLVFSLENEACVPMRPYTGSGLWVTLDAFPAEMYIYNLAGDLIYNKGYTTERALALFQENDETPSSFDAATKTLTLTNLMFGTSEEPGAGYSWVNRNDPTFYDGSTYKIKADGFTTEGAVNEILDDSNNGVKRFFNLQGLEIAEPAAGEIVIVKEGNKTYKTILR